MDIGPMIMGPVLSDAGIRHLDFILVLDHVNNMTLEEKNTNILFFLLAECGRQKKKKKIGGVSTYEREARLGSMCEGEKKKKKIGGTSTYEREE
jgi:hypothetical protein